MKNNLRVVSDLIKVMKADGKMLKSEARFLKAVAQQLGVSNSQLNKLFQESEDLPPADHEFDRILHFHSLVLLMNFDQNIHEKELSLIRDIAIHLGLNPLATEKVLVEMKRYKKFIIPPDRMIAIFKENYN